MPAMKILSRILTDEVPGGYRLTMETDDGAIIRVFATENQLADLGDEIDEILNDDDADLTAKDEEPTTEEQPS